jgi:hypothetical protein
MLHTTAKLYGLLVLVLGIVGLLAGEQQFLNFLNVDVALDLTRLGLAAMLLNAVYNRDGEAERMGLLLVGFLYVGLGVFGIFDSTIGGVLPDKLSAFDIVFHLVTGVAALGVAAKETMPAARAAGSHHLSSR